MNIKNLFLITLICINFPLNCIPLKNRITVSNAIDSTTLSKKLMQNHVPEKKITKRQSCCLNIQKLGLYVKLVAWTSVAAIVMPIDYILNGPDENSAKNLHSD